MVIKYNTLNRVEPPMLTLCNPGCEKQDYVPRLTRAIGVLQDCEAIELVLNFNSPSELNFRINQIFHEEIEDITERHHVESLYEAVQNRRVIFAEMVGKDLGENPRDEVGFFQITNVETGYSDGHYYKDVTAQSIEVEFQQWTIPYIEDGTYYFCEPTARQDDIPAILNMIVDRVPLWTIGHIDDSLQGGSGQPKLRTFEDVDVETDCLSFMLENLQETYDCIILFDPITRTVNAYDKANYVKVTDIHLTTDDVISGAKVTDNAGDLCTALNVRSSEDVGISAVNPLGGNTIYDFSYYKSWMSPELAAQVTQWEYDVEHAHSGTSGAPTPFMVLVRTYYEDAELVRGYEMEIERLTGLKTQYERCRDNIVAANGDATLAESNKAITSYGGTAVTMLPTIPATVAAINQLIEDVEGQLRAITRDDPVDPGPYELKKAEMDWANGEIEYIQSTLTPENYFRPNLLGYVPAYSNSSIGFSPDRATALSGGEAYEWSFEDIGTAASWRLAASFWSMGANQIGDNQRPRFISSIPIELDTSRALSLRSDRRYLFSFDGIGTADEWRLVAAFFKSDGTRITTDTGFNFSPSATYSSNFGAFRTDVISSREMTFMAPEDCYVMLGFVAGDTSATSIMDNPKLCTLSSMSTGINGFFPRATYDGNYGKFVTGVISSKSLVFTPSRDCYVSLSFYGGGTSAQTVMRRPRLCKRTNGTFDELIHYIYQGDYVDEYTVITSEMDFEQRLDQMLLMLNKGKEELSKVSTPSEEFDIDVESVLFSERFEHWDTQLETGCLINVDLVDSPNMVAAPPEYIAVDIDETEDDPLPAVMLDTYKATRLAGGERYIFSFEGIGNATNWHLIAAFFGLDGTRMIDPAGFGFSPEAQYDDEVGVFYTALPITGRSWVFTAPTDCYVMLGFCGGDTTASAQMINPYLRKADGDVSALFLSTITVNYDDCNLKLTFGNKYNKFDPKSLFDKVLGNVTKTATDLSFVKSAITNIKDGQYDAMREAIEDSRNVTMRGALVAENQQFVLDESGFTGRTYNESTGEYSDAQIKITAENIVFTRDGWDSAATAIGHLNWNDQDMYGVNAEVLIGNLIIGEELILSNPANTMTFDENGLKMTGGNFEIKFNPGNANSLMYIKELAHDGQQERMLLGISNQTFAINNEVVRVAWNGTSDYIQLEKESGTANLNIYTTYGSGASARKGKLLGLNPSGMTIYTSYDSGQTTDPLMSMTATGANYYYKTGNTNYWVGRIGTNAYNNYPDKRGIVFDLNRDGAYMSWGYQEQTGGDYVVRMMYCPNSFGDFYEGFTFWDDMYLKTGYKLSFDGHSDMTTVNSGTTSSPAYALSVHSDNSIRLWGGTANAHPINDVVLVVGRRGTTDHTLFRVLSDKLEASVDLDMGGNDVVNTSDERLKTNIQDSEFDAVALLNEIDVKSFDWIETGAHEDAGIIAQNLREVIPDAVAEDEKTGVLSIKQLKLIPYLVKAVQELAAQEGMTKSATITKRSTSKGAEMTEEQKRDFVNAVIAARNESESADGEVTSAERPVAKQTYGLITEGEKER